MVALSKSPVAWVCEVKMTALPSGSTCGQRWVDSFLRLVERRDRLRLAAGRRHLEQAARRVRREHDVPSGPQLAPRLRETLQRVRGVPPLTGSLRISDDVT